MTQVNMHHDHCTFNEGYNSTLKLMNLLNIRIGLQAKNFARMYNEQ